MSRPWNIGQSKVAKLPWPLDFTKSLLSGVTVSSAVVTHTPPSGGTVTTPSTQIVSPIVYVTVGPLGVTGVHYVDVLATFSDATKDDIRLVIRVDY